MERYTEYKSSGIPWIGDIPSHWEVCRMKKVFTEAKEKTTDEDGVLLSLSQYTGVSLKSEVGKTGMFEAESTIGYNVVHRGQFVMNIMLAWNGSYAVSDYDGIISPSYAIFDFKTKCNKKYIHLLLRQASYAGAFKTLSKGIIESRLRLYPTYFFTFPIILPTLAEQDRIVNYLSNKTLKIDAYVAERERELQLLNELKQSEIANVVTKGLNPNVKMKDSGIFWQPQIPCTWNVTRLKYILTKLKRASNPDDELLVCSNSGEVKHRGDSKLGLVAESNDIYQGVKAGDLLIHGMDTWHGAIAVSNYDGMCTPVVHVCDSTQNKHFIALYLRNMANQKIFKLISNGVRQNTSDFRSWDKLAALPIPLPSVEEQNAIVEHIDESFPKINSLITELEQEIEYLKEYKQRLIADAVTGQIKV